MKYAYSGRVKYNSRDKKTLYFCGQISQATGMIERSGLFYLIYI
jgi:hypothetical protein